MSGLCTASRTARVPALKRKTGLHDLRVLNAKTAKSAKVNAKGRTRHLVPYILNVKEPLRHRASARGRMRMYATRPSSFSLRGSSSRLNAASFLAGRQEDRGFRCGSQVEQEETEGRERRLTPWAWRLPFHATANSMPFRYRGRAKEVLVQLKVARQDRHLGDLILGDTVCARIGCLSWSSQRPD
jgi:hypothetical protein